MKRLVLLTTVLLLVLVACGDETETVEVSGSTGSVTVSGDSLSDEGEVVTGEWTDVSDDRLKGENKAVIFCEMRPDEEEAADCEGTTEIVNDGGTWEGTFTGTSINNNHDIRGTLTGTGDYEGLQFTYRLEGTEYPWTITGTIEPAES